MNELTAAANWLVKTEYYLQAWQMYDEALTLAPTSAKARAGQFQLAHIWLRDFHVTKDTADETLSRVTAVLYRGLPKADQEQVATILAHIGWAQVLRVRNKLPVFLNVDSVFCPAEADRPPTRDTHENAEQSMKL